MEKGLKSTVSGLLLLFGAATAEGGNLCNQNCELTISFPGGGSLEAVEALTITFGDGGLVDTAGSVTAYVAGETLMLNAGESLDFGDGGSFDIGDAGNIDYTDMAIVSDGEFAISAVGGDEEVLIPAGSRLAFPGAITVNNAATIVLDGELDLGADSTLSLAEPGQPSPCDLTSSGGVTLSVGDEDPLVIPHNTGCLDLQGSLSIPPVISFGEISLIDPSSNAVVANFSPSTPELLSAGPITRLEADAEPVNSDESEADDSSATAIDAYSLVLLLALLWIRRVCESLRACSRIEPQQ